MQILNKNICALLYLVTLGHASEVLDIKNVKNLSARNEHLSTLMEDLRSLNWDDSEAPCLNQILKIITNVQNSTLWAVWIWDSMQLPVGQLYGSRNHLGNYDECMEFPWREVDPELRPQYCLANIHLSDVDSLGDDVDLFGHVQKYIQTQTKHHLKFNNLKWGVCVPAICNKKSIENFVYAMYRKTHIGIAVRKPNIQIQYCDVAEIQDPTYSWIQDSQYNVMGFFAAFFITVTCTFYVSGRKTEKKSVEHLTFYIAKAFHMPSNMKALVEVADDDIRSVFGIRVISSLIVLAIHQFIVNNFRGIVNAVSLDKAFGLFWLKFISNFQGAVDTFLFLSGLFMVKSLLGKGLRRFSPFKVILRRYFRLAPQLIILLMFLMNIKVARGPVTNGLLDREVDACRCSWWKSLLMIQNYLDPVNMCFPHLWSVSCDFQMSVVGIIIVWVYTKSRKTGYLLFLTTFIASVAVPAVFAYSRYKEAVILYTDFQPILNYREYILRNSLYTAAHMRGGAYLVGMAVGYLMSRCNPVQNRNVISHKYSILGFGVFVATFVGLFSIGVMVNTGDLDRVSLAAYVSLNRIIWALLIGFLIIIIEYGALPLVRSFLGWSAWGPLSKLSYGIYLVHPLIMVGSLTMARVPQQFEIVSTTLTGLGVMVVSSIVSLSLWIFFEAPIQRIFSRLLK